MALLLIFIDIPDQVSKPSIKSALDTVLYKLDLVGFVFFAPAAIQLLLALEYGQYSYGWNSATVIGLFCGSGATFIVFLIWEHTQGERAMIPLAMVARRNVWASSVVMVAIFGLMLSASYYLPVYFQAVKNASPMLSGVYILPSILSQLLAAVISGALSKSGQPQNFPFTNRTISREVGILSSVGCCMWHSHGHFQWSDINVHPRYFHGQVGWLPDFARFWPRRWLPNGMLFFSPCGTPYVLTNFFPQSRSLPFKTLSRKLKCR